VQEVEREFGLPVISIANLHDLLAYLRAQSDPALRQYQEAVEKYRQQYGV